MEQQQKITIKFQRADGRFFQKAFTEADLCLTCLSEGYNLDIILKGNVVIYTPNMVCKQDMFIWSLLNKKFDGCNENNIVFKVQRFLFFIK